MAPFRPEDLTVIIPTRDRWDILARTLDALRAQTVRGFSVLVVVDGTDQAVPDLGVPILVKTHGGPGAARNFAVERATSDLVLFLGDDMVPTPTLVERHLARHQREPAPEAAVLGHVDWHPEVRRNRLIRWLDWSGSQFDYHNIEGEEAGFGRFYSSNVSLRRSLFVRVGGFDEDFVFDYEDLDIAWRLNEEGMRLVYERQAVAHHLHRYDWARLERRYRGRARAERLMVTKHPWFSPFFADRIERASARDRVSPVWSWIVDVVLPWPRRVRRHVRRQADCWYHQRLAPSFREAWDAWEAESHS